MNGAGALWKGAWTFRVYWGAFAVLLLDVEHFKNVNDSLGHAAGDELLVQIGERLQKCVRAADTVSRFGGDEFTVLVENVMGPTDATRAAQRVRAGLAAPFKIGEHEIFTSVSIGITICVITQRVCSGVIRRRPYFFFLVSAGFFAALAVSMRRLVRALSFFWRALRRIFHVLRLSLRPIGRRL